jgi:GTP-binding protein Era
MTETTKPGFVSGFVSLVGRPNAGKSSLLNALVGSKVAIVAPKPQTTRTAIQGVLTTEEGQAVFLDTPGIHQGKALIHQRMMQAVREALAERDLLLFVADARREIREEDREAVALVARAATPVFAVLNKIDLVQPKSALLPVLDAYRALHEFQEFWPVSARTGEGVDELRRAIFRALPQGPAYFPADHLTDQPERFLVAELIRERVLHETRQEIPHAVTVMVDQWEDTPKITRVAATVYVEREGQKAILIGAGGERIKRVGTLAREEIERLLGRRFFLGLHVKVRENWRENPAFLNALDWRTMAGGDGT